MASFTDSSMESVIADQASCAAGWDPLSSSGRRRLWHVHCTLAPKLVIYSLPIAVQQWLSVSNPSKVSLQPRVRSDWDQLKLYVNFCVGEDTQGRFFLPDTSMLQG